MTQATLVALLGRPLSTVEVTNFDLYLKNAKLALETLTCLDLSCESGARVYDTREGYRTLFTDVFTGIYEVKLDGEVVTDYQVRQWNRRNGDWYNSLVFDDRFDSCDKEVEVNASWGFNEYPSDLQSVLAGLFAQITKKNKFDPTIQSKQVEDFRITLNVNADLDKEFYKLYSGTIAKYKMCDIANVQHGKVC